MAIGSEKELRWSGTSLQSQRIPAVHDRKRQAPTATTGRMGERRTGATNKHKQWTQPPTTTVSIILPAPAPKPAQPAALSATTTSTATPSLLPERRRTQQKNKIHKVTETITGAQRRQLRSQRPTPQVSRQQSFPKWNSTGSLHHAVFSLKRLIRYKASFGRQCFESCWPACSLRTSAVYCL